MQKFDLKILQNSGVLCISLFFYNVFDYLDSGLSTLIIIQTPTSPDNQGLTVICCNEVSLIAIHE